MGTVRAGRHEALVEKGVSRMSNVETVRREPVGDFVSFFSTGMQVKGEFHCAGCGYGVTVCRELPTCPMCGGDLWEQTAWSPFERARSTLQ
jgi:hypothetical protein